MNRLAIVGDDERVRVIDADAPGAPPYAVSPPEHRCAWPTWSPDGSALLYSAYPAAGSNGHGAFRLIAASVGAPGELPQRTRTIYTNEPGTDAIAQHTPHYAMWSPDGGKLAFIAQTLGSGMSLMVADAAADSAVHAAPLRLLGGAPLYFCWSLDAEYILAHTHGLHYLIKLSEPEPAQVPIMSQAYQSPSVSAQDGRIAMCGEMSETTQGVIVATIQSGAEIVGEVEGSAALAWRPDRPQLAIASGLDRGSGYYDTLTLLDANSTAERVLLEERMLCFFWSPDGRKIAYITPSEGAQGSVRWGVLDLETDDVQYLADFVPSHEQLTLFMFFDQYGQSHRVWSADGSRIVFSGVLGRMEVRGPLPDRGASGVYVADVGGEGAPEPVGQGTLAVFS